MLSTSDVAGGAARAAHRLHVSLRSAGIDSRMLVQHQVSDGPAVIGPRGMRERLHAKLAPHLDRLPLLLRNARSRAPFSTQWLDNPVAEPRRIPDHDLLHLHWVCGGFLSVRMVSRYRTPVVWTMHDMWPLTGGCHYDDGCRRYRQRCGCCPVLSSSSESDLSRAVWRRKARSWRRLDMTIVAPSRWLATCARESSLFRERRVEVIPNGIPLERYRPWPRSIAREMLGLPQDRRLIAFGAVAGAVDRRKGYHLLMPALRQLASQCTARVGLVVFGSSQAPGTDELRMPAWFLGVLHDDVSLALVYSAADLFVAPSLEDNLPNTVVEATACGVPSVAWAIGGMPDIIRHEESGYLARPFDLDDLVHGMRMLVDNPEVAAAWGEQARRRAVMEFDAKLQAERYTALYRELLGSGGASDDAR